MGILATKLAPFDSSIFLDWVVFDIFLICSLSFEGRLETNEICGLVGYYAASCGNFYRRFGTTYRSHPHGSRVTQRRVIPQKTANFINIMAEA
jgi:hypothetical protein